MTMRGTFARSSITISSVQFMVPPGVCEHFKGLAFEDSMAEQNRWCGMPI
jgi:hypothetical protein